MLNKKKNAKKIINCSKQKFKIHTIFYVFWYNFFRIPKLIQTICNLCAVFFICRALGFFCNKKKTLLTFGCFWLDF